MVHRCRAHHMRRVRNGMCCTCCASTRAMRMFTVAPTFVGSDWGRIAWDACMSALPGRLALSAGRCTSETTIRAGRGDDDVGSSVQAAATATAVAAAAQARLGRTRVGQLTCCAVLCAVCGGAKLTHHTAAAKRQGALPAAQHAARQRSRLPGCAPTRWTRHQRCGFVVCVCSCTGFYGML